MSATRGEDDRNRTTYLGWLRLGLAAFLFSWSLLTVFEVPIAWLWRPAIVATEWGHVLAGISLALCAVPGWRARPGQVALALVLPATLLFLSPLLRATDIATELPGQLLRAFGEAPPLAHGGAPQRPAPLDFLDLFTPGPRVELEVTEHLIATVDQTPLSADLYLRSAPTPLPVVLAIHGGSWRGGDRKQLPALHRYLAGHGFAVLAIDYRLAPRSPFPAAKEDVLRAVDWVKREGPGLGLDPTSIVLLGRSAGGHLALLAAYASRDPAIRGVVAYYPPTDMVWSFEHPSNPWVFDSEGVLRGFLDGPLEERRAAYRAASPIAFVDEHSPPTLLIHGARDEFVAHRQSARLAERLAESGVAHLLLTLPWATHACDANLRGPSGQLSTFAILHLLAAVRAPAR